MLKNTFRNMTFLFMAIFSISLTSSVNAQSNESNGKVYGFVIYGHNPSGRYFTNGQKYVIAVRTSREDLLKIAKEWIRKGINVRLAGTLYAPDLYNRQKIQTLVENDYRKYVGTLPSRPVAPRQSNIGPDLD